MIKLMIVDDEAIIRKGIHYYIDWAANGIEVIAEAEDGQEGFRLALQKQPDIIIADIKMPRVNGIEMAQKIREVFPQIKIILLTGYNKNEYLHSAIRFGVTDFILKSANPKDIIAGVLRCKKMILEEREQKSPEREELLKNNYWLLRESLMDDILRAEKSEDEIYRTADQLEVKLPGACYLPFLLQISEPAAMNSVRISLLMKLEPYAPFLTCKGRETIIGILNLEEDGVPVQEPFEPILQQFREEGTGVKMLAGKISRTLPELSRELNKLNASVPILCWSKDFSVTPTASVQTGESLSLDIMLALENEIIHSFSAGDRPDFQEKVSQYCWVVQDYRVPLNKLKESVKRMITSMYNLTKTYEKSYQSLECVDSAKTVEKVFKPLQDIIRSDTGFVPQNQIVSAALRYIENNYAHIASIQDVASACFVTPSYLSKIFKEKMQTGLLRYLHQFRIEKAKELLLSTEWQVAEIAVKTGYVDYKRFSAYFLKFVGISPREFRYRNRTGRGNDSSIGTT